jgi:hypothetical protein
MRKHDTKNSGLDKLKAELEKRKKARSLSGVSPGIPGLGGHSSGLKHKFDKGDLVGLSCGSPLMVIEAILCYEDRVHPSVGYYCTYIHDGRVERNEFAEEALLLRRKFKP